MASKRISIVGTGSVGEALIREASARGHKITAFESDPKKAEALARLKGIQVIRLRETSLAELQDGGVARASLVLATSDDDEQNMRTITYSLELGASRVGSIAADEEHRDIFQRLGAESVIVPARIVAERLCGLFLSPSVVYDVVLNDGSRIAQIIVNEGSSLCGASPLSIGLVEEDHRVIDVTRNERHYPPSSIDALAPGDLVTVFLARQRATNTELSAMLQ
ncbi:TrkA family potassium uptake protein [Candidatus Bipolaricaulota bacterium]|nr:TrkA family potassium uptake protein [Candidatus Bipolaricaulota bacterium]